GCAGPAMWPPWPRAPRCVAALAARAPLRGRPGRPGPAARSSGGSPRLRRPAPRRRRTGHPDPLRRRPGSRPPLGEGATGLADLVPVDGLVAPLQGGLRPLPGEHDGVRRTGLAHGVADRLAPVPDRDEVGAARLPGAALHLAQDLLQRGVAVVLLGEDGDV